MLKSFLPVFLLFCLNSCGQTSVVKDSMINTKGNTIVARINAPVNYQRIKTEANTFGNYLQNLKLKPHGSKVFCFDSSEKSTQDVHVAVIDLDVGKQDLQQCADAVMRLRAEYLYGQKEYDKIHFKFTNGFNANYSKWSNGYRIKITDKGTQAAWYKSKPKNDSKASFREYLNVVFSFAGTSSLSKELKTIAPENMQIGDVFIHGGFPGHAVIVVDVAIDSRSNKKVFMLAQSYMPAQDIHILKNTENDGLSPWFELESEGLLTTPEWTFKFSDLKRF